MPGIADERDGAIQHAPQPVLHRIFFIVFFRPPGPVLTAFFTGVIAYFADSGNYTGMETMGEAVISLPYQLPVAFRDLNELHAPARGARADRRE